MSDKDQGGYEGLIVVGAPRSGTTLLRRILNEHPNIACPGESNIFTACSRFLHTEAIGGALPIDVLTGLGFMGIDSDAVLERLREFAFGFLRDYAASQNKSRWAEKTAFNAFHLENLERLCGDRVRYVLIVRHGLDVVLSLQDLCDENGGYLAEIHEYVKRHPRPRIAFAHLWRDLTWDILDLARRNPQGTMLLRYETLTADPQGELRRVLEFAGESFDPAIVSRALSRKGDVGLGDWKTYGKTKVERTSVDRWKQLPKDAINELGPIVNPVLEQAGYDPVEVEVRVSPEEARRRYELGMLLQGMRSRPK